MSMFNLEDLPVSGGSARAGQRAWTSGVSVVLHVIGVLALATVPLLLSDPLPERADTVRAFFAEPISLTPPAPPPPPAPAASAAVRVRPARPVADGRLVAPVDVPTAIVPEELLGLGVEGGVAEGVEGGVPGGVVGGVVGGLPEAPPPPPTRPVRVGLDIREPRKVKDVPPVYPDLAVYSRLEGSVVLDCVIDARGRVSEVKVLRGLPLLNDAAVSAVQQWLYTPTLINGVPVPVAMTVTVKFTLERSSAG